MFVSRLSIGLLLSCFGALLTNSVSGDEVDPAGNTVTIRGSDTSVRIEGDSGKISTLHFEQDDDDDDDNDDDEKEDFGDDNEEMLSFQVESLQERNSAGEAVGGASSQLKHEFTSFSQRFEFSPLNNFTEFQGVPVKMVNLSTTLRGQQANLELMVMVFLRAGTLTFGNETFKVQNGTMKFNIKVSGWQFCDAVAVRCLSQSGQRENGKYLDLALSIKSEAEEPEEVRDEDRTQSNKAPICVDPEDPNELDDDCPVIYNMGGNSEMVLNRGVLTDNGNYVAMPSGYPKFEPTGMMNKRLTFRIPAFNNTVIIDPSVNVGPSTKDQQGGAGHNSAASSLQFFSLALLLSTFTVYY